MAIILPFEGIHPRIHPTAFVAPTAVVIGNVTIEEEASIWFGAVIRGATGHYDHVAGQCASGIAAAAQRTGVPVIFGVLTTDTIEQAIERAGTKAGNKGYEAAVSAIDMVRVLEQLRKD